MPRVAILCAAIVTLVAAVWAARRDDGLDHLVSVVDIGALTAFILLHASVVGWFAVRRMEGPPVWWRHVLVPVVGAGVLVAVIVEATTSSQVVGVCWLGVGLVVLAVQGTSGKAGWRARAARRRGPRSRRTSRPIGLRAPYGFASRTASCPLRLRAPYGFAW